MKLDGQRAELGNCPSFDQMGQHVELPPFDIDLGGGDFVAP